MPASIDIVIPVYNEEAALPVSIPALVEFLQGHLANPWQVVIADNASTDGTGAAAARLAAQHPGVGYLRLPEKGRGRALRAAWLNSQADLVSYMDVDLATDLRHFPALVAALESGYQVAVGSRLSRGSQVFGRGLKREITSRGYNLLIKSLFFAGFPDAQCGFKGMTRQAAQAIIPAIQNNNWFFDTELLLIAEKRGYRIRSIPVTWHDDPGTTVNIMKTVTEDLKGLLRLRFGGVPRVPPPSNDSTQ